MGLSLISRKVYVTVTIIGFRLHLNNCSFAVVSQKLEFGTCSAKYAFTSGNQHSASIYSQNSRFSTLLEHLRSTTSHNARKADHLNSPSRKVFEMTESQSMETTLRMESQSMETTLRMESQSMETTLRMESQSRETTEMMASQLRETTEMMESQSRETTEMMASQKRETAQMMESQSQSNNVMLQSGDLHGTSEDKTLCDADLPAFRERQDSGILEDILIDSPLSITSPSPTSLERCGYNEGMCTHVNEESVAEIDQTTSKNIAKELTDRCSSKASISAETTCTTSTNSEYRKLLLVSSKKPRVLSETLLKQVTNIVQGDTSCNSPDQKTTESTPCSKSGKTRRRTRKKKSSGSAESSVSEDSPWNVFASEDNSSLKDDELDNYKDVIGVAPLLSAKFDKEYQKFVKSEKVKKKRKQKRKAEQSRGEDEEDGTAVRSTIPNHFVSIQIYNSQIHEAVSQVQKAVVDGEKDLEPAIIPLSTLHFTLMVMRLETEDDMARARLALDDCTTEYKLKYASDDELLELELSGLGHFQHGVLFVKINPGLQLEELLKIVENVERCFKEQNIEKADKRGFQPHVTLVKLSKGRKKLWKKGIKKIKPELYVDFLDTHFGAEMIRGVQLCSMVKPKNKETGYYHIEHEVLFGSSSMSEETGISDKSERRLRVEDVEVEGGGCEDRHPNKGETTTSEVLDLTVGDEVPSDCLYSASNNGATSSVSEDPTVETKDISQDLREGNDDCLTTTSTDCATVTSSSGSDRRTDEVKNSLADKDIHVELSAPDVALTEGPAMDTHQQADCERSETMLEQPNGATFQHIEEEGHLSVIKDDEDRIKS